MSNYTAITDTTNVLKTKYYGSNPSSTGGHPYSIAFRNITLLQTYSTTYAANSGSSNYVKALILYDNNTGKGVYYGTEPASGSTPYPPISVNPDPSISYTAGFYSIDLTNDTIINMAVCNASSSEFSSGVGLGGIYFVTLHGQEFCSLGAENTPSNNPGLGWTVVSNTDDVPCQHFYPIGVNIFAGAAIDCLSFYYKLDTLLTRTVYINKWNSDLAISDKAPLNFATAEVFNSTSESQQMSITFEKSISSAMTYTLQGTLGVGMSMEIDGGIPLIAEGKVTTNLSATLSATIGSTTTIQTDFSYNAQVTVPANSGVIAIVSADTYKLSGSFQADFNETWQHAGVVSQAITGNIKGALSDNIAVLYKPSTTPSTTNS